MSASFEFLPTAVYMGMVEAIADIDSKEEGEIDLALWFASSIDRNFCNVQHLLQKVLA